MSLCRLSGGGGGDRHHREVPDGVGGVQEAGTHWRWRDELGRGNRIGRRLEVEDRCLATMAMLQTSVLVGLLRACGMLAQLSSR